MMLSLPKYDCYKDSEVDWLGKIPAHWEVKKLKHIANFRLSNVDKHTRTNEKEVKLCNYTDVYYQKFITENIKFMVATATEEQIKTFTLEKGDVLITKDSETPDDIAVPAYVSQSLTNVICGYHLAHIKPVSIHGKYLFYAFQSTIIASQFHISATGITRYGIGKSDIGNSLFLIPSLEEQEKIVKFLDKKCEEVERAIALKQKLITLLDEQKSIVINQAVTKGLNPNAPMKDSGIDWLGDIPAHWEVKRAKYLLKEVDERSQTGKEELLSVSHVTGVTPRSEKNVNMFMAEDYTGAKLCRENDLVINIMWAWMGALGVSNQLGIISSSYAVFRQKKPDTFNTWFLEHLLRSTQYVAQYNRVSTGLHSSRLRLYADTFLTFPIILPTKQEQDLIEKKVREKIAEIEELKEKTLQQIEKLKEFKQILIAEAVTGKIKV
jgi:type I restriction enzyme, S subunit